MRILHTSDWHLGRQFHRTDMLTYQAAFLDHLVEVVRSEGVDAVVVAGDVYDRALPSVDVVALLSDALARLRATGATLLLTSGNHDSAGRLGFGAAVFEQAGVHLRTRVEDVARPVVLGDDQGPVLLYGIPYLDPTMTAPALGARARSHQAVLSAAMDRVRTDLAARPAGARSLVAAHAFVVGAAVSESERDISVGGVGAVPVSVFDGPDYVALGHLHGRQQVGPRARYSGSPLPYSFSEHRHRKGSWLVDLHPDGDPRVLEVPAPESRPLALLRGRIEALLTAAEHSPAEAAWCQVTLTDPVRPRDAMARLRARFPYTLALTFEPDGAAASVQTYRSRVSGRDDLDVCCGFLEHVRAGAEADPSERALLAAALEGTRAELASGGRA